MENPPESPRSGLGNNTGQLANDRAAAESCPTNWGIDETCLQLAEELGKGMFGSVRKAYWQGTPVAIKSLYRSSAEQTGDEVKLFEREIAMMRQLHHPNVVQFLGYTRVEETGFGIVMEMFPNGSIEDFIRARNNRLSAALRARFCDEMVQALCYLHNRKPTFLIHRDVKPSNFMLTNSLRVKLGDFGISRLINQSSVLERQKTSKDMDASGSFEMTTNCGTVRYMAPEVHAMPGHTENTRYSPRADIFSVAMCFIFIWEGRPPSIDGAHNRADHVAAIFAGKRPTFTLTPQCMREIITSCLQLQPRDRPTAVKLLGLLRSIPPEATMSFVERLCRCLYSRHQVLPVPFSAAAGDSSKSFTSPAASAAPPASWETADEAVSLTLKDERQRDADF